jgi:methionyl-tRNA formyltransferase
VSGKLSKADGRVDWGGDAITLHRRVRAVTPWPGAATVRDDEMITLLRVEVEEDMTPHERPGTVIGIDPVRGPRIGCGRGVVVVTELRPAGSRPMSGADYLRGRHVQPGEKWG